MFLKLPFFGLLASRSPMDGLTEHYDKIAECIETIDESLECYVSGGVCREFEELTRTIDQIENHADKIKRNIRNHLPKGLFMPVEKSLFLSYTKSQDNVLDAAQDALHWLAMRKVEFPEQIQKDVIYLLDAVSRTTVLLGPALKATIALLHGESLDREGTKTCFRKVRSERDKVRKLKNELHKKLYAMDLDFKDIYQLMHFVDCLDNMGHNTENCADHLRAMIAR
ncbi:TIGR00153 family protein [Pseudodesulfovibrio piezophilus]|uniref:Phosphate transport regulator n=1 Tax=Pseudodesulfovibrio piezophilus (strain DSM 21447 / JCM 15486 / C1TLV30) TaxID=1322246 RepID=M1WM27_PSEP2|nr:TIGR00153 family protein [Pseudodesulfovibrio piezophilus]CCH48875.1 conserved protein of unknown function [Pseudodesulfovibrio piezophilus C1TLV30]